ncbi:metallophosphoesterase [Alcaligenes sp. SDU_A2]|uniref:metallophosphoesterase n=1 Tax=Alcaligenes sp. SDU_A2 TaxID=3136634 RepID=UPI00311FCBAD
MTKPLPVGTFAVTPRTPLGIMMHVPHFTLNTQGRDIAVGDIHGSFSALQAALRQIRFDPDKDRLFSVGDLVDHGPESRQVLDWLAQPWFHAIAGNHELMTWRRAIGQPVQEFDHRVLGGLWLDDCPPDEQQRIAQGLQTLPLAMEVATPDGLVGIVHADFPYEDWTAIHDPAFDADDQYVCMWSIDRYESRYAEPVRNIRALVHGHRTTRSMLRLGNVYFIDTGGWRLGGHFTLLDLHTLSPLR